MNSIKRAALAALSVSIFACSPPVSNPDSTPDAAAEAGPTDTGVPEDATVTDTGVVTDSGVPTDTGVPTDGGGGSDACTRYCTAITGACSGTNAQFDNMADCTSWCAGANIPVGTAGEMAGNTLECRI